MDFELPHPDVELPPGEAPLVLVAPSTAQDPDNRLVRTALEALAEEPVRVVATTNRVRPETPIEVPANAVLVDWLSYSQVMPQASLVICHGGHGTVARALAVGVPVLTCPAVGDMAETAARITWARVGLLAALAALPARAAALGGAGAARRSGVRARGRSRSRRGRGRTTGRSGVRSWWRSSHVRTRDRDSGGGTRTHNLSVNSRSLYELSYPRISSCGSIHGKSPKRKLLRHHLRYARFDFGMAIGAKQDAFSASLRARRTSGSSPCRLIANSFSAGSR